MTASNKSNNSPNSFSRFQFLDGINSTSSQLLSLRVYKDKELPLAPLYYRLAPEPYQDKTGADSSCFSFFSRSPQSDPSESIICQIARLILTKQSSIRRLIYDFTIFIFERAAITLQSSSHFLSTPS